MAAGGGSLNMLLMRGNFLPVPMELLHHELIVCIVEGFP